MREQFVQALKENPYDAVTHAVYADWLMENGFDEEAEVQRRWTVEKQKAAEAFMLEYASELSGYDDEERYRKVSVERVMEEATEVLAGQQGYISVGSQTPEMVWNKAKEFWQHYSVLTGTPIEKGYRKTFVACVC